jgi:hypothetical protein
MNPFRKLDPVDRDGSSYPSLPYISTHPPLTGNAGLIQAG